MRKFLRDGSEVEVMQTLQLDGKEQYIVGHVLMDDDGEEVDIGDPVIVDRVFDSPLRHKYSEESESEKKRLDRYKVEANELGSKIVALRKEQYELESQRKALISKLSQVEALKDIESILEGNFTHYVLVGNYDGVPSIVEANEANANESWRVPRKKILSLFGDIKGGFEWEKSNVFSGYGDYESVIPCLSENDAVEKVRELIRFALERKDNYRLGRFVEAAKRFGVEVPENVKTKLLAETRERHQRSLANARKEVAKALDEIKAAGLEEQIE